MSDTFYLCSVCEKEVDCSNGVVACPHCAKSPKIVPKPVQVEQLDDSPISVPKKLSSTAFKLSYPITRYGVRIDYVRWYKAARKKNKDYNAFFFDGHWFSEFELWFYATWLHTGLPKPTPEYRFDDAKWRFDFAWVEQQIAVEIEGGVWSRGRHTRGNGYIEDCRKYNTAMASGWRVFRFADRSADHIALIEEQLALSRQDAA